MTKKAEKTGKAEKHDRHDHPVSVGAGLRLPDVRRVVLLGAHCDDIVIGAGGTLRRLASRHPDLEVNALVLTGLGTVREAEEADALEKLLPGVELTLDVLGLPDGRLPDHRGRVKDALQAMAAAAPDADLVLAPHRYDAHQDHRLLGELVPTSFRSHLHLGYEVLKWESDLPAATWYQPLDEDDVTAKIEAVTSCYPSQAGRDWFDPEAFRSLLRVRGVQCHRRYAEAFVVEKAVLSD